MFPLHHGRHTLNTEVRKETLYNAVVYTVTVFRPCCMGTKRAQRTVQEELKKLTGGFWDR
jgi:hypothetical protein